MQAVDRQIGGQAEVFFQPAKVGGHQFLQRITLDQVVGPLKGVLPLLRQIQHQDRLVDLHPLHTQLRQALEDLAVQRQQAVEQIKLVKVAALGLAQPQVRQRANHHRLDGVPEVAGFLDFFEQLVPSEVELLIDTELRHQVVIVGIEPLGHLLGVSAGAARIADATGHAEQRLQRGLAIGRTETLRDHAKHQRVSQHLVVPGEITGGQQLDAGLFLQVPMGLAQVTPHGAQAGLIKLALPERFLRFFQFTIASNARKSEGMSDCHDFLSPMSVSMAVIVGRWR
ncbi:hypothetical protein [Pseudomonas sp. 24 E 13]|nr:hypothetical protein [Pseudomonas sp. 24 E 13]